MMRARPKMRLQAALLVSAALGLVSLAACAQREPPFTVFAATSLRRVLEDLQRDPQLPVPLAFELVCAATNTLVQQIAAGARADLLLSADEAWVNDPSLQSLLDSSSHSTIASNRLAVVIPAPKAGDEPKLRDVRDLLVLDKLAIADPLSVPLGRYTRAWLENEGLWTKIQPHCQAAFDSRTALAAVASGALPAGVVYFSDARASNKVQIQFVVEGEHAPNIRYVAAVLRGSAQTDKALELVRYLRGPAGIKLLEKHAFLPPPGP